MDTIEQEKLKYPIGKYQAPEEISEAQLNGWINDLDILPWKLRQVVEGLADEQLNTPYRPDGWTIRQVVHHIADSHMNAYIRFKLTLTENTPTIKPYDQDGWAQLPDKAAPVEISLNLIESLHQKWVYLLRSLSDDDLSRSFLHPEGNREIDLCWSLGLYAWHGKHHLAHIKNIVEKAVDH